MDSLKFFKFGFKYFRSPLNIIFLLILSIGFGTTGYMVIERYSFLEAFYMTMITITTVGFKEVQPLSDSGRIFTIILLITDIGIFFYGVTTIAALLIEGEFRNFFKHYKVNKKIEKLENHVIVCGYGRNGKQVCLELTDDKIPFIVIENRDEVIKEIQEDGNILFLEGDSTEEDILIAAGIAKAKAIITTLPEDPDNVYVSLTSRELNPKIIIISRASVESSESKLKRAGANNVIMPEKIGGAHMAALVTKPDITEFIAHLTGQGSDISITFEELSLKDIPEDYIHKSIKDLDIRNKTGANIIGLRLSDGKYVINPPADTLINPDTKLILLGSEHQIMEMRKLISAL